ncbi:hypothetical protein [Bradyrhizobium sp. ORS 86]|uniref:hypothetical protein n=1 Tax=Bradyrhizobium sp. ORS 86 TaxID=1685970 RepID=UPI003890DA77
MADLSDVTAYLAQAAASAVYPNGIGSPSVAAMDCRIYEGWPIPDQLDLDLAGKMLSGEPAAPVVRPNGPVANVSVFPMQGTGVQVYQILDETYTIVEPSYGMTFSLAGNVVTVTGEPKAGEYLTVIADDAHVYSQTGGDTASLLAALAAQAQADYPAAASDATTLTIPAQFALLVRQGGKATLGKVTHRQRQSVMVTVWAPTPQVRTQLASAIDNLIKASIKVTMPDTSQAIVCYNRTNVMDEYQAATIYRRDLIYDVEYATVEQFPGYVITSTQTSIVRGGTPTSAIATAIA